MLSRFQRISSSESSRSTRAGMPAASERAGMRASALTKASAAHDAAMENRAVPYGRFGARDRVLARKAVQHAAVLDVRALLHHDAAEIAAQARARPDISARGDDHIADQHRARMHEGTRLDDRHDAVDGT